MNGYLEINIKDGMPSSDEAMKHLKESLIQLKRDRFKCAVIIHGYGSSGKGGKIREKAREFLNSQKKCGKVKSIIYGEDFDIFNFEAMDLKIKYKLPDKLTQNYNHGITVIEL